MDVNYNVVQAKQSGDRTKWITVGVAFERGHKFSMKLETYPIPNKEGEVWLNLFERTEDGLQDENAKKKEQKTVYEKSYGGTAK